VSRGLVAAYYLMLWVLILTRPPPLAQSEGVLPSIIAFVGTYLPWAVPALGQGTAFLTVQITSSVLLLCGGTLTIVTLLHLGALLQPCAAGAPPGAARALQAGKAPSLRG
jgi:hypothetical protein